MTETMTYLGELTRLSCWCGIKHAVPSELRDHQMRCHDNGRTVPDIYCPLGHCHVPAGEPKIKQVERERERARNREAARVAERDQAEASARGYKGAATRARKRAKAGVCPCCNRTFKQLARHMESKHPDFEPEAVKA